MNRLYLIVPVILLALFGGVYWQHNRTAAADAAAKAAAIAEANSAEAAKKAEAERKAREDADKRAAERLAEEEKKEADKRAKWEADGATLVAATADYTAQAAALAAQAAALEKEIAAVRADKERVSRETFEQSRAIELARIDRRNAELEIQRMTEMVARKAGETSLVKSAP
jgi:hypothetical protein